MADIQLELAVQRKEGQNAPVKKSESPKPAAQKSYSTANTNYGEQLYISPTSKMRVRLNSLTQSISNVTTGITMLQVTDGYLGEMESVLMRIRAHAVRAATGTQTNEDRQKIQVHVSQLIDEIDRVASQAEFDYQKLFLGNLGRTSKSASMWIHIGPNMHARERIFIATMTASSLNLRKEHGQIFSVSTLMSANDVIGVADDAFHRVSKQRADIQAYIERFQFARDGLKNEIYLLQTGINEIQNLPQAEKILKKIMNPTK